MRVATTFLVPLAAAAAFLAAAGSAYGQAPWHEDFEGPSPSWQSSGGNAQVTVQQHQRVSGVAHTGQGCEWFQIAGQGGTASFIAHDVGRPWVIEELRPSVWVKSDRGGLQFLVEITLPRTTDPRTGRPVATARCERASPCGATARWPHCIQ